MEIIKSTELIIKNAPIFASTEYLKTQSDEYYYLSSEDGNMTLPVVIKKKLIFRYAVFHSGVIGNDAYIKADEKGFLNSAVEFLKKEKIDFISSPSSYV